jgi:polyhydroxybutyrate depolymerase
VAPVSSSLMNNPAWTPVPTLLIHGLRDTSRPNDLNGAQDISQYVQSNQCTGGTQPVDIGTCSSLAGGVAVNPGCVQYSGCAEPTLFCNHDDPNYLDAANNNAPTNHGWPCFANQEIFEFFESLR